MPVANGMIQRDADRVIYYPNTTLAWMGQDGEAVVKVEPWQPPAGDRYEGVTHRATIDHAASIQRNEKKNAELTTAETPLGAVVKPVLTSMARFKNWLDILQHKSQL